MMTKVFERKPHPARRARIATAGISSTAFLAIISSFAWNTHAAELAANSTLLPVVEPTPAEATNSAAEVTVVESPGSVAPKPAVAATPAETSTPKVKTSTKKKKKVKSATSSTSGSATTTTTTKPAEPAAPTVVYTCKSPGGKTENPTSSGKCKNAKYGYVLTQIS